MLYNAFGITLPEMDQAEQLLVASGTKPVWPFIYQNLGMALGYMACAGLAYTGGHNMVTHNLPW